MSWRLIEGDCIEVMRQLADDSADAVVTDPPYGLGFMGKEWDAAAGPADQPMRRNAAVDAVNAGVTRQGGRQRASADFQRRQARDARSFQAWCEEWGRETLRVLRPAGYAVVFGGTRTYHRLVSGLEDAGFEIRDQLDWLFGSGFPKHKSALKPAHEPVLLARKAGARSEPLNIDPCRIPNTPEDRAASNAAMSGDHMWRRAGQSGAATFDTGLQDEVAMHDLGRWPANVALDEAAAAMLDDQSGVLTSGANPTRRGSDKFRDVYSDFKGQEECEPARGVDIGGASRFFYVAKPDTDERNVGLTERNPHPTVKPVEFMRWLVRLVTPEGGTVLDPFMGSGTTGIAALREQRAFLGIDREPEYVQIARDRIIGDAPLLNTATEEAA